MQTKRLDEILLEHKLVTPEQVEAALELQKKKGGLFGSQLIKLGFLDERGLVTALTKQLRCEGVLLNNIKVQPLVLSLIPIQLVWARKIFPFAWHSRKDY